MLSLNNIQLSQLYHSIVKLYIATNQLTKLPKSGQSSIGS